MRVIFLDIDGVLNSHQSSLWFRETLGENEDNWVNYRSEEGSEGLSSYEKMLCKYACCNLSFILKTYPDVRIVVSSTWRRGRSVEKLNTLLKYHKVFSEDKVIGKTPCLDKQRGYEIQQWLEENPTVTDFVILDDDSDMVSYLETPHFIKTDGRVGFDYLSMEKVDKYFGGFNLRFVDLKEGVAYRMYSKPICCLYFKEGTEMVYYEEKGERRSAYFYPDTELFSLTQN